MYLEICFRIIFILVIALAVIFDIALELINLRHMRKKKQDIPDALKGHIDASLLEKTREYTTAKTRFGIIKSATGTLFLLIFIFCGPFASALIKLYKENLANLNPHPLYVIFNYSHPPIAERLQRINIPNEC